MKQIDIEWNGSALISTGGHTIIKDNYRKTKLPVLVKRIAAVCVSLACVSFIWLIILARDASASYFASDIVPLFFQSNLQAGSNDPFRTGGCLNEDWKARSTISVWSMLTDGPNYVLSALKLGVSVQKYAAASNVDLVMMELSSKPLSEETWERLKRVGWQRCTVDRIPPPPGLPGKTKSRFRDQFTKLHLWGMTSYKTIAYLDADTLVVGDLQPLLSMQLASGKKIGAALDFDNSYYAWADTFNMGVFLVHPNQEEFDRLLKLRESGDIRTRLLLAEQAWLNEVYKDAWQDIGFVYNAQDALYKGDRSLWDESEIRVIHYNLNKPWDPWPYKCGGIYEPLCDAWRTAPTERTVHLST